MAWVAVILAEQLTMAGPSVVVLLVLFLLMTVAVGMFWVLLWRESTDRQRQDVIDWSRARRFKLAWRPHEVPDPLGRFAGGIRVIVKLSDKRCTLVHFSVGDIEPPTEPGKPPVPPKRRNVLIWPLAGPAWPAVGLRPTHASDALIDALALAAQPNESTQRFVICTNDRKLGAKVFASSLRGLLPPDVGLILLDRYLLIDFSDRPFDGIEFTRMIAVAEQLVTHVPATT